MQLISRGYEPGYFVELGIFLCTREEWLPTSLAASAVRGHRARMSGRAFENEHSTACATLEPRTRFGDQSVGVRVAQPTTYGLFARHSTARVVAYQADPPAEILSELSALRFHLLCVAHVH